jgi:protein-tyrosine phosphatase
MPDMEEIYKITEKLYIGAYWPQINFTKLKKVGITAIVNLMEKSLYVPPERFAYLHRGFPDNTYPPHRYIKEILEFISQHVKKGKVLVHCAMGISRSGGIIMAWLLKTHPLWTWDEALRFVYQNRKIYPATEIQESILDYLEKSEGRRRKMQ